MTINLSSLSYYDINKGSNYFIYNNIPWGNDITIPVLTSEPIESQSSSPNLSFIYQDTGSININDGLINIEVINPDILNVYPQWSRNTISLNNAESSILETSSISTFIDKISEYNNNNTNTKFTPTVTLYIYNEETGKNNLYIGVLEEIKKNTGDVNNTTGEIFNGVRLNQSSSYIEDTSTLSILMKINTKRILDTSNNAISYSDVNHQEKFFRMNIDDIKEGEQITVSHILENQDGVINTGEILALPNNNLDNVDFTQIELDNNGIIDLTFTNIITMVVDDSDSSSRAIDVDTGCLNYISECKIVVDDNKYYYTFNSNNNGNLNKRYGLSKGRYIINNVPQFYALGLIYNDQDIIFKPSDEKITIIVSNKGNTVETNDYFRFLEGGQKREYINIIDGEFKFMRNKTYCFKGSNLSPDEKFAIYIDQEIKHIQGNESLEINIPSNATNSDIHYGVFNDNEKKVNLTLLTKEVNGIVKDFYYGNVQINVINEFDGVTLCSFSDYIEDKNDIFYYTDQCEVTVAGVENKSIGGIYFPANGKLTSEGIVQIDENIGDNIIYLSLSHNNTDRALYNGNQTSTINNLNLSGNYQLMLNKGLFNKETIESKNTNTNYDFFNEVPMRGNITFHAKNFIINFN